MVLQWPCKDLIYPTRAFLLIIIFKNNFFINTCAKIWIFSFCVEYKYYRIFSLNKLMFSFSIQSERLPNRRITEKNCTAEKPRRLKIWGQRRDWSLVSFDYPCLCSPDINEEPSMFLVSTFLNYDVPSIMLLQH